jgi:hypothetical protein
MACSYFWSWHTYCSFWHRNIWIPISSSSPKPSLVHIFQLNYIVLFSWVSCSCNKGNLCNDWANFFVNEFSGGLQMDLCEQSMMQKWQAWNLLLNQREVRSWRTGMQNEMLAELVLLSCHTSITYPRNAKFFMQMLFHFDW